MHHTHEELQRAKRQMAKYNQAYVIVMRKTPGANDSEGGDGERAITRRWC